jgi:hypothetical protein
LLFEEPTTQDGIYSLDFQEHLIFFFSCITIVLFGIFPILDVFLFDFVNLHTIIRTFK